MAVLGLDFFPEAQGPELQLRQLLPDLALEAILVVFVLPLAAARKHPAAVAPPSYQQNPATLCRYELG
jgi:hypothetical protein